VSSPSTVLVVAVHSGTRQALHHALSLALMGCVDGSRVAVALFYDGLAAWQREATGIGAGFGAGESAEALREGFARLGHGDDVGQLLDECRSVGGDQFRVVACGGSVEALGMAVDDVVANARWYDDVVGLPTIWRWAGRGRLITV